MQVTAKTFQKCNSEPLEIAPYLNEVEHKVRIVLAPFRFMRYIKHPRYMQRDTTLAAGKLTKPRENS